MPGRRARSSATALVVTLVAALTLTLASCSTLHKLGGKPLDTDPVAETTVGGFSTDGAPKQIVADVTSSAPTSSTPAAAPATRDVAVTITPSPSTPISPITPIEVKATGGTLTSVLVTNANGVGLNGHFAADKTSWKSTQDLAYGKRYSIAVTASSPDGRSTTTKSTVTTINPKVQAYPSVVPPPAEPDIGVGMPLTVRFDHPIKDHRAAQESLSVTSSPKQAGAWYWIDSREVHYRPAVYWKPGTQIELNINVFGVDLGGGMYGQTNRTVHYSVHDSWIAKADGATQTMLIYHNEQLVNSIPISMGKDATPTHIGTHVVSEKHEKYVMDSCSFGVCKGPDAYVATEHWAVRISNDGEFVHENPLSVHSQGHANVSHGCINLNEENAKWFFAHFNVGDVVEVNNSGGKPLPIYDRYGDWAVPWEVWKVGNA